MSKLAAALFVIFWASLASGYIPPSSYVLEQVVQKSPLKNIKSTPFNSMVRANGEAHAASLRLESTGLKMAKQPIELYSVGVVMKSKSIQALKSYLDSIGVNMNIVSLGFFGNEPAYIIGAEADDIKSPQLWVDKTKWLIVKEHTKKYEITFDKWQSLRSANTKFPRLINLKTDQGTTAYSLAEMELY